LPSSGFFIRNSSWQAKQSIPYTPTKFYGDCMKMCEDFTQNVGDERTGWCIMTRCCLTLPVASENFLPKTKWMSSSTHCTHMTGPPETFLFPTILT
jgi:hypothetical protein